MDKHPSKAYAPYPAHLSTGQSRTPIFAWKCDYSSPSGYEGPFYSINLWKSGHLEASITTTENTWSYEDTLESESEYTWRVTVESWSHLSTAGDTWQFTTGTGFNNPPHAPRLINPVSSPPDYTHQDPIDVAFEWTCFDPDGDDLTYDVLLGEHGGPLAPVSEGQSATEYQHPSLELSTLYDWQVVAHDAESASEPSEVATFRTAATSNHCPDRPIPIYPPDHAVGVPIDVPLSWRCTDTDGDDLVYTLRLYGQEVLVEDIPDTTYLVEGLDYGTTYQWELNVFDGDCRISGDVWEFTTMPDPALYLGVYAEMIVHRSRFLSETTTPGEYEAASLDHFSARFDSVYAPDGHINPLRPPAVENFNVGGAEGRPLWWVDVWNWYYYNNPISGHFLAPGVEYYFDVSAGDGVPALETDPILFPECQMTLSEPLPFSSVSRGGFTVSWTGYGGAADCPGTVRLRIQDASMQEWTDVDIVTENDGSYAFTAGDLSSLDPMVYQIMVVLIYENTEQVVATGYDPRGFVRAEVWSTVLLDLQ
jgi:hypothetical protein